MGTLEQDLTLAGHGDRAAFARVYDDTVPYGYRLARCILEDPDQAERALVAAYQAAWVRVARYDAASQSGRTWILIIIRKHAQALTSLSATTRRRPTSRPASRQLPFWLTARQRCAALISGRRTS